MKSNIRISKIIFILLLFCSNYVFSQVGVNTNNPQRLFHIDGKSSASTINPESGIPSIDQQIDDVVVTNEGKFGIGTIDPTEKLSIHGNLKIRDTDYLTSENFYKLYINEFGIVGKLLSTPNIENKQAVYASSSDVSLSKDNFNNNLNIIIPISANHTTNANNTANTTVLSTGEVKINEAGYYLISGGITPYPAFRDGPENIFLYMSLLVEIKKKNNSTWSTISGGRPVFERAGYIAPIGNQTFPRNYTYTIPTTVEILEPGDLIRIRMTRSEMGTKVDALSLRNSYGAKPYVLTIEKL